MELHMNQHGVGISTIEITVNNHTMSLLVCAEMTGCNVQIVKGYKSKLMCYLYERGIRESFTLRLSGDDIEHPTPFWRTVEFKLCVEFRDRFFTDAYFCNWRPAHAELLKSAYRKLVAAVSPISDVSQIILAFLRSV
jgi:hypothetical protein